MSGELGDQLDKLQADIDQRFAEVVERLAVVESRLDQIGGNGREALEIVRDLVPIIVALTPHLDKLDNLQASPVLKMFGFGGG